MANERNREETTEYSADLKKLTLKKKKTIKWFNPFTIETKKKSFKRGEQISSIPKGFEPHYNNVIEALIGKIRLAYGENKTGEVYDADTVSSTDLAKDALETLINDGEMTIKQIASRFVYFHHDAFRSKEEGAKIATKHLQRILDGDTY